MTYTRILSTYIAILFLIQIISAECLMTRSPTGRCLYINTVITAEKGGDVYFVGDAFHYDIILTNEGTDSVNTNFTVNVYDPNHNLVYPHNYLNRTINPKQTITLYPYWDDHENEPMSILMSTEGPYTVQITSSIPLTFFKCSNTSDIQSSTIPNCTNFNSIEGSYLHYFGVMPEWEKDWINNSTQLMQTQNELSTKTVNLTEKIANLTEQTKKSNDDVENLTKLVAVFAFFSLIFQVISLFLQWRQPKISEEQNKAENQKLQEKERKEQAK